MGIKETTGSKVTSINKPVTQALLQNPTEDNVALAFKEVYGKQYVYLHDVGKWHRWTGKRWALDDEGSVLNAIRELARDHNPDGKAATARSSFYKGVETILRHDPGMVHSAGEFDADNYLLNTPGGIIDLRTGETWPATPEDCVTMITEVSPSNQGGTRFLKFMQEITDGDPELVTYLQTALGACLSGAIESHWLLFWYGPSSRNGKNTLGDTIKWLLGDYAGMMPTSALMSKERDSHATEMMNLKGKRLVISSEVPEGKFWDESRLKECTGEDELQGRYLYRDWVRFRRTHKHLIYGNHQPSLKNIDMAIQSRFKLVPFNVSFLGREDAELPSKLRAEASFILQWLIQGHTQWLEDGRKLPQCRAVDAVTREYFGNQGTVDNWLEERCVLEGVASAKSLYLDYMRYKEERNEQPQNQTRWGSKMASKFEKGRSNGIVYAGVSLK